jgi:hypothetical protein
MTLDDQNRTKKYGLQWNQFRILQTEEDRATFLAGQG